VTLKELAAEIGAELSGDGEATVSSAATLQEQGRAGQLPGQPQVPEAFGDDQGDGRHRVAGIASPAGGTCRFSRPGPLLWLLPAVVKLHGYRRHPHPDPSESPRGPGPSIGEGTVVYPGVFIGRGRRWEGIASFIQLP